jgi:drug/metabolite transporter (DMT)-like permease
MTSPQPMHLADWGLLIILSVLWGGSFLFIGIAVKELTPLVIVFARVALAAAALLPLHLLTLGPLPRGRAVWFGLAGMSLLNNVVPFTLIVTGQTMIASGLASVINATAPLFGAVFLAMAGDEALSLRKLAGLVTGLAGVAVLKGADFSLAGGQTAGMLLCLAAAACYGLSSLWVKRRLKGVAPLSLATGQLLLSAVIMTGLAFGFDQPGRLLAASGETWAALLGLALLATALAYILFFRIVARSGAANVLLVTMLIPVSAILFGHFILGEVLSARELVGALVIGLALVIFDGRLLSRFSQHTA